MPQLNAYIAFDGNCAEAMRFYERVLGGTLTAVMTYGQSPMADQCSADERDLVMHAHLQHPDFVIMGGDATSGMPYQRPQGITMTLSYPTVDEARRVFGALAEGGTTAMPLTEAFWAEVFGMCTDRFGVPWIVNGALKPLPV